MSRRVGNAIILEAEDAAKCELCGKVAELRPYGPNGDRICFECGKKNPEVTERQMARTLFGEDMH